MFRELFTLQVEDAGMIGTKPWGIRGPIVRTFVMQGLIVALCVWGSYCLSSHSAYIPPQMVTKNPTTYESAKQTRSVYADRWILLVTPNEIVEPPIPERDCGPLEKPGLSSLWKRLSALTTCLGWNPASNSEDGGGALNSCYTA